MVRIGSACILAVLVSSISPVYAEGGLFVPPFMVGAMADYDGPSNVRIVVEGAEATPSQAGGTIAAVSFAYLTGDPRFDVRLLVREADALIESERSDCRAWTETGCAPWTDTSWGLMGIPAVFGATALQSRSFNVGDEWVVTGSCRACLTPLKIAILAPDPTSPEGTDFVAELSGELESQGYLFPRGRLHMSRDSAFPLAADFAEGWYERRAVTTSGIPHPLGGHPPLAYAPPLQAVGFDGRFPVEGERFGAHPTLAEAFESAGSASGERLVLLYSTEARSWSHVGGAVLLSEKTFSWTVRMTDDAGADAVTTYSRGDTQLLPGYLPPLGGRWSRADSTTEPTPSSDCVQSSVPLWDLARYAHAAFPTLTIPGTVLLYAPDCETVAVSIYGAYRSVAGEIAVGAPEEVRLDPRTGLAIALRAWRG